MAPAVRLMSPEEMDELSFDPLDPTKTWPEDRFPFVTVGTMTLNRNPQNFFAEVEQVAFSQVRWCLASSRRRINCARPVILLSGYARHRLGANYLQIPINCPYAPVRNHQRMA